MTTELQRIEFSGHQVHAAQGADGQVWVSLRQACDAMGIQVRGQREKLEARSWATIRQIQLPDANGSIHTYNMITARAFNMWLATIHEDRVSEAARPQVVAFQQEAADALEAHFNATGQGVDVSLELELERERTRRARIELERAKIEAAGRAYLAPDPTPPKRPNHARAFPPPAPVVIAGFDEDPGADHAMPEDPKLLERARAWFSGQLTDQIHRLADRTGQSTTTLWPQINRELSTAIGSRAKGKCTWTLADYRHAARYLEAQHGMVIKLDGLIAIWGL